MSTRVIVTYVDKGTINARPVIVRKQRETKQVTDRIPAWKRRRIQAIK